MLSRRALIGAAVGATLPIAACRQPDTGSDATIMAPPVSGLPPFEEVPYGLRRLDGPRRPYARAARFPLDKGTFDAQGVKMYQYKGRSYDHPVVQSAYVLNALATREVDDDPAYLERALANGRRLRETLLPARDAAYAVYPFDYALHGRDHLTLKAPWYSAMAQGRVLSAFTRLREATGDETWADAAEQVFASFRNDRTPDGPWTQFVDDGGRLWFEEYPHPTHATRPDRAFNGHVFALYGVFDHWATTGGDDARRLVLGGIAAAEYHARANIRNPGCVSYYCIAHRQPAGAYHGVHIRQLLMLHAMTRHEGFARLADAFVADHPGDLPGGRGRVRAGTHRAVTLSGDAVTAEHDVRLPDDDEADFDARRGIRGRPGVWLRIDSGVAAGRWLSEGEQAHLYRPAERHLWDPRRVLELASGRHAGLLFDDRGVPGEERVARLAHPARVLTDERAVLRGLLRHRVAEGPLAGTWIANGDRARLRA